MPHKYKNTILNKSQSVILHIVLASWLPEHNVISGRIASLHRRATRGQQTGSGDGPVDGRSNVRETDLVAGPLRG